MPAIDPQDEELCPPTGFVDFDGEPMAYWLPETEGDDHDDN